ncbi:U11/U12 small nuclear ribonucleoprotein 25 kDa protein-like [Watersipora subatra]|uniref:U11/U12 small nuclear ribonucleoprotein 25 kDa protein-like n=1 Tax=Watersipora subatra TaxID=2589382 RepID=UPI00355B60A7
MDNSDISNLSHVEICSMVTASLCDIIKEDPVLSDIPGDATLAEVNSQIAVEHGQSIRLYLDRYPLETVKLAVVNNSSIQLLKQTIKQQVSRHMERQGVHTQHLSWKYFWRKHWLTHNGVKLMDDKKTIKQYGIKNRDSLQLCKRLRERGRHSRQAHS